MKQNQNVVHEIIELTKSFLIFLEKRLGVKINKIFYDKRVNKDAEGMSGLRIELDDESSKKAPEPERSCADRCPVQLIARSGDVFLRGNRLCTIGIGTLPFHYLNLLICQYPNASTYQDIARTMKGDGHTINRKTDDIVGAQGFCFDLKRQIKSFSPLLAKCIVHCNGFARVRAFQENYRIFPEI